MIKKLLIICLMLSNVLVPKFAFAEDQPTDFYVKAILPDSQMDSSVSYFNLRLEAGQEEVLEVEVGNATDQEIVVQVEANTAFTNNNGVVEYSETSKEVDSTLIYSFSELATIENEKITIPANETKLAKVVVAMPENSFDGVVLGGLKFSLADDEEKQEEQIKNVYSYTIGVLLSENDTKISPVLQLNEVEASQVNFRNVVTANIQNTKPVMVQNLNLSSKIYFHGDVEKITKAENGELINEMNKADLKMAPNSNFDLEINWNNEAFKPGLYVIQIDGEADGEKISWSKEFKIDAATTKKLNESAMQLNQAETPWMLYILGLSVLMLLVVVILLLVKNKKSKK